MVSKATGSDTRTLLNHFFGTFYGLRSLLQAGGNFDQTVAVGWLGSSSTTASRSECGISPFNRWLKYPLAGDHDPLLSDKRAYFEKVNGILNDAGDAELDDPHLSSGGLLLGQSMSMCNPLTGPPGRSADGDGPIQLAHNVYSRS